MATQQVKAQQYRRTANPGFEVYSGGRRLAARFDHPRGGFNAKTGGVGAKVIQVGINGRTTRMTCQQAREFAADLVNRAAAVGPGNGLVVEYRSPGAKHPFKATVGQAEVQPFVEEIYAALRDAKGEQ